MNWYIIIFTSTDYYTYYNGMELVKANNIGEVYAMTFPKHKYHSIETVIDCGKRKPKEV